MPLPDSNPSSPPAISVVVRSMDRPSLARTLASVEAQSAAAEVEVVLVNALGAAHGATPAQAGLAVVRRLDTGRPLARSAAANAGLDAARGRWLVFLDDDDVFLPGHLDRLCAALRAQPDAAAAYADVSYGRDGPQGWVEQQRYDSAWDPVRLQFENYIPLHAALVDRARAQAAGCRFDESLDLFEDWDWFRQLAALGPFVHVPGVSARYQASADPAQASGVFADTAATEAARAQLLAKWAQRDSIEQRLAATRALQGEYRAHRALRAQLDLCDATTRDLREALAARQAEVDNGVEHARALQRVVDARDAELLALRDAGAPGPDLAPVAARTTVFTIVSRNYLHFALNLMDSVACHLPGTRRVVVLCDAVADVPPLPAGIELLGIGELGIGPLDRMVLHYTILELNTAIKPFAFAALMARGDADRVVYFDPDIQLYSSGEPLLRRLDHAQVVLTPHLGAPLDDGRHPSDLSIVQSGSYNLGFLALRCGATANALLAWWQGKLVRDCVVDIPRGLFTDQKWMDLVPSLHDGVLIERDAGWNVAYWNLAHRDVQLDALGHYRVGGRPLFFFHFSGYMPGSGSISKHQDRFTLGSTAPAVQQLFHDYDLSVAAQGRERFATLPYAFATLADGTPLPDCARRVLREQLDAGSVTPDLRTPAGARFVVDFLNEGVDALQPPLSRLAEALHASRDDLRRVFPDVRGAQRAAYLAWFRERAPEEARVPPALLGAAPVPATGAATTPAAAQPAAPVTPLAPVALPSTTPRPPLSTWPYRAAYRAAWSLRDVLRPLVPLALRQRVRNHLVQRAYATAPAPQLRPQGALPWGLTVVGYVHAESGVGESARASLRALSTTDVPHAVHDFRAGNVSRMGEVVDERVARDRVHAVSLFHINADQLPHARASLDPCWFEVPHRIGFWAWELEHFPDEWQGAFDHVDEVWVPSSFCQAAVAERSPVPVLLMPHAVQVPEGLDPDRARFGLAADEVVFLAMADVMSSPARKNPFGAVEAYVRAFGHQARGVRLVVKVSNGERDPAALQRLRALAADVPSIQLIEGYLDRPTLATLLDSVDAFVSLHRAEGFGLVIAEAMARGKVVVATDWSGNTDFMSAHNAMPVDFHLVELQQDDGPYRQGQRWAEPDLDHAARCLRQVAGDAALRQRLGARARADAQAQLSPSVIGAAQARRLAAIRRQRGL